MIKPFLPAIRFPSFCYIYINQGHFGKVSFPRYYASCMKRLLLILTLILTQLATFGQGWRLDLTSELNGFKMELETLKKDPNQHNQSHFLYYIANNIHGLLQDSIKNYSAEILHFIDYKAQWPKDKDYVMDCPEVFGMLDLPDSIKQFVLADSCTPLHVKARLGDKKAERQVIRQFKKIVRLKKIENGAGILDVFDQMLYIKSPKAIKYYLKGFKSKAYWYSPRKKANESLVFWMMWKFTEYYKCDPIKKLFRTPYIICTDDKNMRVIPIINEELKAFEKEMFKIYHVRMRVKAPFLLQQTTRDTPDIIYDFRLGD